MGLRESVPSNVVLVTVGVSSSRGFGEAQIHGVVGPLGKRTYTLSSHTNRCRMRFDSVFVLLSASYAATILPVLAHFHGHASTPVPMQSNQALKDRCHNILHKQKAPIVSRITLVFREALEHRSILHPFHNPRYCLDLWLYVTSFCQLFVIPCSHRVGIF